MPEPSAAAAVSEFMCSNLQIVGSSLHPQRPPARPAVDDEQAGTEEAYFARKPASCIKPLCIASFFSTHLAKSAPVMNVSLNEPSLMKSFQSCVSRTFFSRST